MGAGASQSKPEDLYVGISTPTAPPLPPNNAKKLRNAEQRVRNADKKLKNIENSRVAPAPAPFKWSNAAQKAINNDRKTKENALKPMSYESMLHHYNMLSPGVKNAIKRGNTRALLTESNQPSGGGMKLKNRRATKKAHKNSRRHSRRN